MPICLTLKHSSSLDLRRGAQPQNFYGGDTQLAARSNWEGGRLRKACLLIQKTTQLISGMFISMGVVTLDIPSNLQGDIRNPIQ